MISFNDLQITDKTYNTFIPAILSADIHKFMNEAGIPCKSLHWRKTHKKFPKKVEIAREKYKSLGFINVTCMTVITSNVKPDDLFQKTLLFFGDTIDPDYKKEKDKFEKRLDEECAEILAHLDD